MQYRCFILRLWGLVLFVWGANGQCFAQIRANRIFQIKLETQAAAQDSVWIALQFKNISQAPLALQEARIQVWNHRKSRDFHIRREDTALAFAQTETIKDTLHQTVLTLSNANLSPLFPQQAFEVWFKTAQKVRLSFLQDSLSILLNRMDLPALAVGELQLIAPEAPPDDLLWSIPAKVRVTDPFGITRKYEVAWEANLALSPLAFGNYLIEFEGFSLENQVKVRAPAAQTIAITGQAKEVRVKWVYPPAQRATMLSFALPEAPNPEVPSPTIWFRSQNGFAKPLRLDWGQEAVLDTVYTHTPYEAWTEVVGWNELMFSTAYDEAVPLGFEAEKDGATSILWSFRADVVPLKNPVTMRVRRLGLPDTTAIRLVLKRKNWVYAQTLRHCTTCTFPAIEADTYEVIAPSIHQNGFIYQAVPPPSLLRFKQALADTLLRLFYRKTNSVAEGFAPHVDVSLWPLPNLPALYQASGARSFILGFLVQENDPAAPACTPKWGGYSPYAALPNQTSGVEGLHLWFAIQTLRAMGGTVALSLGGAAGTHLEVTCPDAASLAAVYEGLLTGYALEELFFDIEGKVLGDEVAAERRSQALRLLQVRKPQARVWFTLPVLPSGLPENILQMVKKTLQAGVKLAGINLMTMNYGPAHVAEPSKLGQYSIQALKSTHGQLKSMFAALDQPKTEAEIWTFLGATAMIGQNDLREEVFTPNHAIELTQFAAEKELGLLSMWSLQRDLPCTQPLTETVFSTCSGLSQAPYAFSQLFNRFDPVLAPSGTLIPNESLPLPAATFLDMAVFPNPFQDVLHLQVLFPRVQPYEVQVWDVLGRQLARYEASHSTLGKQVLDLDARTWSSGLYIIVLKTEGQVRAKKAVKLGP